VTDYQLKKMAGSILASEKVSDLKILGLKSEHQLIFPAIVALFMAIVEILEITKIDIHPVALRHGVLFSLINDQEEVNQLAASLA
jgi:exopolyphosphatase/pppGpp-phosphohydrolase